MNPTGSVVWITGASSGIGEALSLEMARAGAKLILSARREDRLSALCERCKGMGAVAHPLPLDVTETKCLSGVTEAAIALHGPIDILVLNAGLGQRGLALDADLSVTERLFEVNFFGAVGLAKAVLPKMVERKCGQIVVTSSVLGRMAVPGRSSYCATKHALHGYFDALRSEVARHGVVVTMICPGYIRTEISLNALEPDGSSHGKVDDGQEKGMSAEACAKQMIGAIRRGSAEVVIGGLLERVGVLLARWCPPVFRWGASRVDVDTGRTQR